MIAVQDDWTLTSNQMFFLIKRHNAIAAAYENDDMDFLDSIKTSEEYRTLFGDMPWDETYDRYECMLDEQSQEEQEHK